MSSLNVGYLTSKNNEKTDESYTPFYAVQPIIPYLPLDKTFWCPFDKEWSAFVVSLRE